MFLKVFLVQNLIFTVSSPIVLPSLVQWSFHRVVDILIGSNLHHQLSHVGNCCHNVNVKKDYSKKKICYLCCREEIITEEQDENNHEVFADKSDAIPGLGNPLVVIDDPTPPESPVAAADKPGTDPVGSSTTVSNVSFSFRIL